MSTKTPEEFLRGLRAPPVTTDRRGTAPKLRSMEAKRVFAATPAAALVVGAGPVLTWLAASHLLGSMAGADFAIMTLVVALMWSPFFFSVPSLLMQHSRDAALPGLSGAGGEVIRGVLLVPALLARTSEVRLTMSASLVGLMVLLVLTAPELAQALKLLV